MLVMFRKCNGMSNLDGQQYCYWYFHHLFSILDEVDVRFEQRPRPEPPSQLPGLSVSPSSVLHLPIDLVSESCNDVTTEVARNKHLSDLFDDHGHFRPQMLLFWISVDDSEGVMLTWSCPCHPMIYNWGLFG
jgi:hypothetical protein